MPFAPYYVDVLEYLWSYEDKGKRKQLIDLYLDSTGVELKARLAAHVIDSPDYALSIFIGMLPETDAFILSYCEGGCSVEKVLKMG